MDERGLRGEVEQVVDQGITKKSLDKNPPWKSMYRSSLDAL